MVDMGHEVPIYKEHTLASGEIITMQEIPGTRKPWVVECIATNREVRWSVDFYTQAEAEKEYIRFD